MLKSARRQQLGRHKEPVRLQVDLTNGEQIPQLESLLADLPAQLLQRQD